MKKHQTKPKKHRTKPWKKRKKREKQDSEKEDHTEKLMPTGKQLLRFLSIAPLIYSLNFGVDQCLNGCAENF
jgi:hypothetical protein